jgi:hypothetical protein
MSNEILKQRLIFEKSYTEIKKLHPNEDLLQYKTLEKCKENFHTNIVVRIYKLFHSKVANERKIKSNNHKKPQNKKDYVFAQYFNIKKNKIEKSLKIEFYNDVINIYNKQTKEEIQENLTWIKGNNHVNPDNKVCCYCGVSEEVLSTLFTDEDYICKTKRARGAWFELDREDATRNNNNYSKDNMVLSCYFCNNHKSDVISSADMKEFFGKKMYMFLMSKYNYVISNK